MTQEINLEEYNKDEEFLYIKSYMFIKGYAVGREMPYTLKALPLVRKVHNGQYRKGEVEVGGAKYRLPYVLHVLKVASTLLSLSLPLDNKELDYLIASALLHDSIEDGKETLGDDGYKLVSLFDFPEEIYDIVTLLSKNAGATSEELEDYFNNLKKNKLALLIKLSDRSHNVEDLYNMKPEKLHKYVEETREYIYPLTAYAKANYPELSPGVTIIKSKIVSLTELTEVLVDMYNERLDKKDAMIQRLEAQLFVDTTSLDADMDNISDS